MTALETLHKELEQVNKDLIAKHRELGMEASGRWGKELEVQAKQSGAHFIGTVRGADYTGALQFGRKPGGFPPINRIEQWIEDKRITSDIPVRSLAFLIARKISREGTRYFKQGGTDLVDSVLTPQRIDDIVSKVGVIHVDVIVSGLVKELEKLAVAA